MTCYMITFIGPPTPKRYPWWWHTRSIQQATLFRLWSSKSRLLGNHRSFKHHISKCHATRMHTPPPRRYIHYQIRVILPNITARVTLGNDVGNNYPTLILTSNITQRYSTVALGNDGYPTLSLTSHITQRYSTVTLGNDYPTLSLSPLREVSKQTLTSQNALIVGLA